MDIKKTFSGLKSVYSKRKIDRNAEIVIILSLELFITALLVTILNPITYTWALLLKLKAFAIETGSMFPRFLASLPSPPPDSLVQEQVTPEAVRMPDLPMNYFFLLLLVLGVILFFVRGLGSQLANWITIRLSDEERELFETPESFLKKRGIKVKGRWIPFRYKIWFLWGKRGEFPLNKLLKAATILQIIFIALAVTIPYPGSSTQNWFKSLLTNYLTLNRPLFEWLYSKFLVVYDFLNYVFSSIDFMRSAAPILALLTLILGGFALVIGLRAGGKFFNYVLDAILGFFLGLLMGLALCGLAFGIVWFMNQRLISALFYYIVAHGVIAFANNLRVAKFMQKEPKPFDLSKLFKFVFYFGTVVPLILLLLKWFCPPSMSLLQIAVVIPLLLLAVTAFLWSRIPMPPLVDERREGRLFIWPGYFFGYLEILKRGFLGFIVAAWAVGVLTLWIFIFYFHFSPRQILLLFLIFLVSYRNFVRMWKDFSDLMGGGRIFYFAARGLFASIGVVGVFALMSLIWPSVLGSTAAKMFVSIVWVVLQGFFASGVDVGSTATALAPQPEPYELQEELKGMDKWWDFKLGAGLIIPKGQWKELLPEFLSILGLTAFSLIILKFKIQIWTFIQNNIQRISYFKNIKLPKDIVLSGLILVIVIFILIESMFWKKDPKVSKFFLNIWKSEFISRRSRATPPNAFLVLRFTCGHSPFFGYDLLSNAIAWRLFE